MCETYNTLSNSAGVKQRAYVWHNGSPVAQIDANGTAEALIQLHTDHLATARVATNAAGAIIWTWAGEAFGAMPPQEDVDNDGVSTIVNLRFPGQYYDVETGLYYNYYRYYDPVSGRYVTSDPIGLVGGLNTFIYANQNPTYYLDREGDTAVAVAGAAAIIIVVAAIIASQNGSNGIDWSQIHLPNVHIECAGKWCIPVFNSESSDGEGEDCPEISPEDLEGKTPDEIRDLAEKLGLKPFGDTNNPDYPKKWKDSSGNERLRLDRGHTESKTGKPYDDAKAAKPHVHGYDQNGKDITVDGNKHIPTK